MKLWLLRHGEAEAHARTDAQRELTQHGRKEAKQSAGHLPGHGVSKIVVSPYVRAQQTALIVREVLASHPPIETANWLTPDGDLREAVDYLDAHAGETLLLVSHQPFIGELAGLLQHGHRQAPLPMKTASLAELQGELPLPGAMHLNALHHPHKH